MKTKITIFLFFLISASLLAQEQKPVYEKEIVEIDSIAFPLQERFQGIINRFKKNKYYIPKIENDENRQILNNKIKALEYAKFIVNINFGKKYANYPKKYFISEDKEKNLWFVYCCFLGYNLDGAIHMIIVKKNCKMLYYFAMA